MDSRKTRWIGGGLLLLLVFVYLFGLYRERERSLWDFKTYYYAAQAFRTGENPYDPSVLSRIAGEEIVLPYVYPPFTLIAFLPFTLFEHYTAFLLFFALKIVAIILLFALWKRFLGADFDFWFLPFALVVFNSALPLDVAAGNISVFEQILLWTGFLAYLRGRDVLFAGLVAAAALFKFTPLFFLVLLFFRSGASRWMVPAAAVLVFAAIQGLSQAVFPELTRGFLGVVGGLFADPDARGLWNPSTFALIRDLVYETVAPWGGPIGARASMIGFLLAAVGLVGISLRKALFLPDERDRIVVACLLYILLVPRLQVYSYLILIPAAFLLIKQAAETKIYPIVLFFVMSLSGRDVFFPGLKQFYSFFWDYSPWMIAFALWIYAIRRIPGGSEDGEPEGAMPESPTGG